MVVHDVGLKTADHPGRSAEVEPAAKGDRRLTAIDGLRNVDEVVLHAVNQPLLLAIAVMWTQAFNPFLYFQF